MILFPDYQQYERWLHYCIACDKKLGFEEFQVRRQEAQILCYSFADYEVRSIFLSIRKSGLTKKSEKPTKRG